MSEATVLARYIGFYAFIMGMFYVIGLSLGGFGVPTTWADFQLTWSNMPSLPPPASQPTQATSYDCGGVPGYAQICGFGVWAWGGLSSFFSGAGNILGYAGAMVLWFFTSVFLLFATFVFVVTFTVPGIPLAVQALLWSVFVPIDVTIGYIVIRAVRGGG